MRVRPYVALVLLGAVVAVVYALFAAAYLGQRREQDYLASEIALLRPALERGNPAPAALEKRLAAAEAELAAARASFPARLSNAEVVSWILQTAQVSQVKAFPVRSGLVSTRKVGEHNYRVLRLEVKAEGSFSQLMSFIDRLETGELHTMVLDKASITINSGAATAQLDLSVYALPHQ